MHEIDEARLDGLLRRFQLEKGVRYADEKFSILELSTGQKKRLALVSTILEDKPAVSNVGARVSDFTCRMLSFIWAYHRWT